MLLYFKVLEDDFPDWFFELKRSGGIKGSGRLRCYYTIRYIGGEPKTVLDYTSLVTESEVLGKVTT